MCFIYIIHARRFVVVKIDKCRRNLLARNREYTDTDPDAVTTKLMDFSFIFYSNLIGALLSFPFSESVQGHVE